MLDRVILVCGGSNVGKSYLSRHVLGEQYRATVCVIDQLYTVSVTAAGMVDESLPATERKEAERAARSRARDRRWNSPDESARFWTRYELGIRENLRTAAERKSLAVFDGGTFNRDDEVELVLRSVREAYGEGVIVHRLHLTVPYQQWIEQRVERKRQTGFLTVDVATLTRERYDAEMAASKPRPHPNVGDVEIRGIDDVHEFIRTL